MLTEDYCDFETAKLLKEKGFDEPLQTIYRNCDIIKTVASMNNSELEQFAKDQKLTLIEISAPTLYLACKWLREVHNLCLFVIPATIDKTFRNGYALYPQCDSKWEWCASKNDRSKATFGFNINKKYCDSYEQACEVAIKYCLENLI